MGDHEREPGEDIPTTEATTVLAECPSCGSEVPVTAGVAQDCPSCGTSVTTDDVPVPKQGGS